VVNAARQWYGRDAEQQKFERTSEEVADDSKMRAFKKRIRHDPDNTRPEDTDTLPGAI